MADLVELVKDFRFEAAHFLPNVPEGHKCRRTHGHSFRGEIAVRGPLDPHLGWVMDFADLRGAVEPLVKRLDHYLLNEIEKPPRRGTSSVPQGIRVVKLLLVNAVQLGDEQRAKPTTTKLIRMAGSSDVL